MEKIKNLGTALKVKEVRKSVIFTLLMLVIFRIGSNLPVPGINHEYMEQIFNGDNMGLFELFNLFSGGSFSNFTIFALGVTPYITASIIVQLLTIAFPYFENLSKEGLEGRKKMSAITRYMTIGLALIQGLGLTVGLFKQAIVDQNVFNYFVITILLTAGTAFLMWLGEQINEYGIGNGISLLIFGGIVARLPGGIASVWQKFQDGGLTLISLILLVAGALLVIAFIVCVQQAERRVPVQYAKKVIGRKAYGGQSTHIPIKVNQAGVIPIIFAMAILQFPLTIMYFFPHSGFYDFCNKYLSPTGNPGVWVYAVLNIILIIFFNFFYTAVTFKPDEVSTNLKQNGGFIPGIRPGKATYEYLKNVSDRLCLVGGVFLALVAILPTILSQYTGLNVHFGGTSLLIAVGVALDTMKQLENRMIMRNYQGFLR